MNLGASSFVREACDGIDLVVGLCFLLVTAYNCVQIVDSSELVPNAFM